MIEDTHNQLTANRIAEAVKSQLGEQMEGFNSDMEAMRDAVEHIMDAAKMITRKMDEFKDKFQETTEQLTQATQKLTEKTTETTIAVPVLAQVQAPITYAAMAQQSAHAEVIVRGAVADKQILVQRNKSGTSSTDNTLPEIGRASCRERVFNWV